MDLGLVGKTQRPVTNAHVNQSFIRFCHVNPFIRRYETSFFPIFSSIEYVYCTSRFSDIFFLLYGRRSNLSRHFARRNYGFQYALYTIVSPEWRSYYVSSELRSQMTYWNQTNRRSSFYSNPVCVEASIDSFESLSSIIKFLDGRSEMNVRSYRRENCAFSSHPKKRILPTA